MIIKRKTVEIKRQYLMNLILIVQYNMQINKYIKFSVSENNVKF